MSNMPPPPAGGFGAPGPGYPPGYPQQMAPPPAPKKGMSGCALAAILLVVIGVPVIGVFSVLAIYGVRKYIANAKTAEARNTLGVIARDAVTVYEADRHLCASATRTVPVSAAMVKGTKYQSTREDWNVDAQANAGFACLKFEMTAPQYFQYVYTAEDRRGMEATAHGDLNGDGVISTFSLKGAIQGESLMLSPVLYEMNPEE